ncbi:MAG: hypothetical protein HYR64_01615 [Fimbriimonas ginsengisoli]|uniref:DUF2330 domain-containing protein n=1 Tax=Fimbriimonas ginsengisoli TaxID=1005039 RepID=A0A931PSY5_FIMGI|nr:hypothetical protein [Fimbriimonas ginsengisoli]
MGSSDGRRFCLLRCYAAWSCLLVPVSLAMGQDSATIFKSLHQGDTAMESGRFTVLARKSFVVEEGPKKLEQQSNYLFTPTTRLLDDATVVDAVAAAPTKRLDAPGWMLRVDQSRKTAVFSLGPPHGPPCAFALSLEPGPCFPLGHGLSLAESWTISTAGAQPIFNGILADGSFVKAWLNPHAGYLPTRIERTFKGTDQKAVWTFERPFQSPGGVFVPSATHSWVEGSTSPAESHFDVKEANFSPGAASIIDLPWFLPGYEIFDTRAGPNVRFTYKELLALNGNDPHLDPVQLLSFTRSRAGQLATAHESARYMQRLKQDDRQRPWQVLAIIAFVAAPVLGGWMLLRFLRSRAPRA